MRSIRAVRYMGAIFNAVLNSRDTDSTGCLHHDVAVTYEIARAMMTCTVRLQATCNILTTTVDTLLGGSAVGS